MGIDERLGIDFKGKKRGESLEMILAFSFAGFSPPRTVAGHLFTFLSLKCFVRK
jgi:hypothetical protein